LKFNYHPHQNVVIITQERLDEITLSSIPDAGLFLGEFAAHLSPTRLEGLVYAGALEDIWFTQKKSDN
jgi:hypothetical protein